MLHKSDLARLARLAGILLVVRASAHVAPHARILLEYLRKRARADEERALRVVVNRDCVGELRGFQERRHLDRLDCAGTSYERVRHRDVAHIDARTRRAAQCKAGVHSLQVKVREQRGHLQCARSVCVILRRRSQRAREQTRAHCVDVLCADIGEIARLIGRFQREYVAQNGAEENDCLGETSTAHHAQRNAVALHKPLDVGHVAHWLGRRSAVVATSVLAQRENRRAALLERVGVGQARHARDCVCGGSAFFVDAATDVARFSIANFRLVRVADVDGCVCALQISDSLRIAPHTDKLLG